MDRTPSPPRITTHLIQRFGLRWSLANTLRAVVGLLVVGSIGVRLALRAHAVPPFDWQLSVGACADYAPDLQEFRISYHTLQGDRTLVSALLPVH